MGSGSRACFLLVALFLSLVLPARADTLLVVPFENSSRSPELEWVGESFAVLLTERLAGFEHVLIPRRERLAGLERLGLPPTSLLTRASLLRLGEEVGAEQIILGRFTVQDHRLAARARLLDLSALSLSDPISVEGPLTDLIRLQTRLAWQLLRRLDPDFPVGWPALRRRFPDRELPAFESYIRGLRAFSRDQQVRYFLQAARSDPQYAPPAFRLGLLYFEDGDYAAAADWFSKVADASALAPDARFYLSLSQYMQDDVAAAAVALRPVAGKFPVKEVWNNLAVYASRQGRGEEATDYFDRALAAAPNDSDVHFNLGLHHARRAEWARAAAALQDCVALHPGDTEAYFLLAHALERLGRADQAARARQRAVGDNPALELSLERRELDLDRLVMDFDSSSLRLARRRELDDAGYSRARHAALHIRRGEDLLAREAGDEARQEFTQAILLDPDSSRAHFLLARVYQQQGRSEEAVSELKASLWSRDTVAARLLLAEIYLAEGRLAAARAQVDAALALDPGNPEARALADRLAPAPAEAGKSETKSP